MSEINLRFIGMLTISLLSFGGAIYNILLFLRKEKRSKGILLWSPNSFSILGKGDFLLGAGILFLVFLAFMMGAIGILQDK